MDKLLHSELISEVKKLKRIVSELKIEDLVNFVIMEQKKFNESHLSSDSTYLSSPLRQGMYLLAIACSQSEPSRLKVSIMENALSL